LGNSLESALLEQSSDSAQLKRVAAQLSPDVSQDAPGGVAKVETWVPVMPWEYADEAIAKALSEMGKFQKWQF
jgi:hypothetical protein